MGVILPFEPRPKKETFARPGPAGGYELATVERALRAAVKNGCDSRGAMAVARPLLELCRDRYGFSVMRPGLPTDPQILTDAILNLVRALRILDAELTPMNPLRTFGVYFGQKELAWFEDGYGSNSGLAVPNGTRSEKLVSFIRARVAV